MLKNCAQIQHTWVIVQLLILYSDPSHEKNSLHVSWKQTMFTPHMAATSTISPIRLCMAVTCGGRKNHQTDVRHLSITARPNLHLVRDEGVGGEDDVVLNESNTDASGRPQLFLRGVEPVALQLKVTLRGSVHGTWRQVQLPVHTQMRAQDECVIPDSL